MVRSIGCYGVEHFHIIARFIPEILRANFFMGDIFPEHFRLDVLPYKYRKEEFDKIKDYKVINDPRFKRTHSDICKNMLQEQASDEIVKKFKQQTIAQDEYRNMNIKDFHPQLAEFIYER